MKEREAVLREAAAAICFECSHHSPVNRNGAGVWGHRKSGRWTECEAGDIYDLIAAATAFSPTVPSNGRQAKNHARRINIYRYIILYNQQYHTMPTYREIAGATGIPSTSVVAYHLARMEEAGLIYRVPYLTRSTRLVRPLRRDYAGELNVGEELVQGCGHPTWGVFQASEGTAHCWVCELLAKVGEENVRLLSEFYEGMPYL